MREILMKREGDHLKPCIEFTGMEHMGSHQEAKSAKPPKWTRALVVHGKICSHRGREENV
jgi:hypothetical protein